jgi:hypothetical protein
MIGLKRSDEKMRHDPSQPIHEWPLLADSVAKVVLPKVSKILRAADAVFV